MKIIATIPSNGVNPMSFIIEVNSHEIAALAAAPSAGSSIPVKRSGQHYSIPIKDLVAGDEPVQRDIYEFRDRALNINGNAEEIKKAISTLRGALTKLENITNTESKKEAAK